MNEVLRQEKKFLLNAADAAALRERLENVMSADGHNGPTGYLIRSLYFDTVDDKDLREKTDGLELRRKIRLRVYAPNGSYAMLEMKQKQGAYQKKRSLRLSRGDAEEIASGNFEPLLEYADPFAAECFALMHQLCYRARTVVEYGRLAYTAKENRIRITLDSHLKANEADFRLFSADLPLYPVMDPFNQVLEVKYNGFLLSYIKDLVNMADRSELAVSKYCLARGAGLGR